MTTSIPRTRSSATGFTLTEVMIAATLSAIIMAGVLSAFLMLSRTGLATSAYSEMDAEVRRALDIFGADARRASGVHWNGSQSVTLTLAAAGSSSTLVTYAYDSDSRSATYQSFYRVIGDATSTLPRRVLVRGVGSDFSFQRYKIAQPGVADAAATSDLDTKRVALTLRSTRLGANLPQATQSAISASYILRNKRVTN